MTPISDKPTVVMMCGLAGSGKTTYSKKLEEDGFVRLSIDEEIWNTKGRYGIDYPKEKYNSYNLEAEDKLRIALKELILSGKQVVIDFSFWSRHKRNQYKQLIEEAGGQWKLIYLKANPNILRQRLTERNKHFDSNAAFPITENLLSSYIKTFEEPVGENEIIIEQNQFE